ncbi:GNAT family N-acetyltransferase [Streptomyces sp. NBC_01218]|uniref:GNAT family N-acetyltransferase n=1 Tax=unclassified Streptomyces TaxID=2593676 RepID=UPI0023B8A7EC|nr:MULTISPECIES: GNAT family protein [unclassified Streptomyces]WEH41583.1 GNAT family protein [Streptomyces sp. AM 2-1-1]WSQ53212.1 GNAT family N-acetyltransferase [Streptomyces sp. NBC_01218]
MNDAPRPLSDGRSLRPAAPSDAPALAAALVRSRTYMAPFEPVRPDSFYTPEGQAERLAGHTAAGGLAWVAVDEEDRAVASFTLSGIVRGAFRSAALGYWVDVEQTGRGIATAAVGRICDLARDDLGLHRVEAGTLTYNLASQRVLVKCGFEEFGTAPRFLHIDGEWRDHRLFQRILHDDPPRD